ncbi:caspase family protein [Candidatus Thiosymbion oneisti]|uniref:caspase family protein n=1 Tax=Candidatus Thiosymbion oneisti TaxID=589554 RepID=UPI000B10A297|nr:caspase family protein [Candidatus Thiosymbion oneisti]
MNKMIRKWLAGSLGAGILLWLLALAFPLAAAEIPRIPFPRIETGMHTAAIRCIAVDRAERFLVTGSDDKTARIWSLPAGDLLRTLRLPIGEGNEGKIYAVAISPDGQTVAVGGWTRFQWEDAHSIYLFDRQSGQLRRRLTGLPNVIHHLDWSPDGRYLAAGLHGPNGIRVYSSQDWEQRFQDRDYGDSSYSAHFDGRGRLVTTSYDGYLRLYDERFRLVAKQKASGGERPFLARFSPDGKRIAVGFHDTTAVDVLSATDLGFLYRPDTSGVGNGNLMSVAWSQDGLYLYAGGRYNRDGNYFILRWNRAGRGGVTELPAAKNTLMDLRHLSDGGLVFGTFDPAWGLLDARGQQRIFKPPEIADFRGDLDNFLVTHDGSSVQFGYEPWGKRPARFSLSERRLFLLDDRPKDTETAALGLKPPRTKAPGLDITDWKNTYHPKLNGKPLRLDDYERSRSLAIAPDGERFLLGTEWSLRLFDRTGKPLWRIPVPGVAWGVNITGNGKLAVAAFGDGTIRWYRLRDGTELLALFPHKDGRRWVAWTPAGFYQASAGGEDLVGWHVNRERDQAAEFYGASRFRQQFYRPDVIARVLETLDVDQALRLADAARGQETVTRDVLRLRPPSVSILAPAAGSSITETKLVLTYEARSETGPIEGIEARIDGRPAEVLAHHPSYRDGKQAVIGQISLEIPPSKSVVSIIARNRQGTSESANFAVDWTGSKDWYKPDLYVLAVGVGNYEEDALNLKFAGKDAQDFLTAIEPQKKRGLYREVRTRLLDDTQATRTAVLDGLDWLERQTTSRDVAILFLAGHGVREEGHYRFLPHDTDRGRLRRTTLKDTDFKDFLGAVAGKAILFLDTCFSGRVLGGRADSQADMDRFANELADAETGVIVFSSSTGKQLSHENAAWGNGAFTEALLEGIREGKADYNGDGHISVAELEVYVSDRVKSLTQGAQKPVTTKPKAVEDLKIVRIRK